MAAGLEAARRRTLALTDADDAELVRQHSPLMSPLVWDLAHIGQQEDLWLLRHGDAGAQGLLSANVERLYDAFEHPRAERVTLPLLTPQESRAFVADVRSRVLDDLDRLEGHEGTTRGRPPRRQRPSRGSRPPRPASTRSSRTSWSSSTSSSTSRRCSPRTSCATARRSWGRARRCRPGARCRRGRPARARSSCPPGPSCSASTAPTSRGRWTTSGRPTSSSCPPSPSERSP